MNLTDNPIFLTQKRLTHRAGVLAAVLIAALVGLSLLSGLVAYLVGLQDESHALQGPMAGALFETACVAQFYKRFSAFADPCSLYYYRSTDGLEVDLLIETGETIHPIEIKLSSTINYGRISSLVKWLDLSHIKNTSLNLH